MDQETNSCCKSYKIINDERVYCGRKAKLNGLCGYHKNFKEPTNAKLKSITTVPQNKLKKSEIVQQLMSYGVSVNSKLTKNILLQKLLDIKSIIVFFTINTSVLIKIQALCRKKYVNKKIEIHGPGIFNKNICNNDTDFCSLDTIDETPVDYFYSFKDVDNFYYWFDIRSLYKLFVLNKLDNNPYTRNKLSCHEKEKIVNLFEYKIKRGICMEYQDTNHLLSKEQLFNQKVINVFQKIDELNYNTNIDWFNKLSLYQLKILYRELEDIWNYRAQLSENIKKNIIGDNKIFTIPYKSLMIIKSLEKLRDIVLTDINTLISNGKTRDDSILGATYVLSGLVLVSKKCAESYPFLLQQFAYL